MPDAFATDPGRAHVVVVDDEAGIRSTLRELLEAEGYRVSEAEHSEDLFGILDRAPADLVLLDLRLRGEDGLDIARSLLGTSEVPVIFVTAKADALDRVVGLELGADDYITKPFHLREVLARVRTVLRRYRSTALAEPELQQATSWSFDGFTLDCRRRQVTSPEGNRSVLTTSEFDLLVALLRHANQPLSRDRLMDLLKGKAWMANDRAIDNRILRLRRTLSSLDGGHDLIQSVRGYGYVLAAEAESS